ncbi:somatic embryogenesis receptor kinase 2-like isoform X1 [Gossypium raimondii]|uniref:somatic embryogenesis receptor kinase 2-like isoform X1 n=1 Tax=Gossypium raimondii TaxID=29730 RepID=UPI00227CA88F|nr:somatic embryogenesis receptor kinase 2-like isoform X1 [Gossypium raimondii]
MAFSFYTCFAILLFSLSIAVRSSEITRATNNDSESLVAEEKALMETGWWSNYSDIGVHHCTWPGVRCSATGSVIEIDLSGHGRNGSITPQIGALFKLKCLNLSSNNLRGMTRPPPISIRACHARHAWHPQCMASLLCCHLKTKRKKTKLRD